MSLDHAELTHAQKMQELLKQDNVSAVGLKAFFRIAELWKLTTQEQMSLLGLSAESTLFKWKKDVTSARVSRDQLDRISYILGIFKSLQILFTNKEDADTWVKKSNSASIFGGKSALEKMCSGHLIDIAEIRLYLDSQRG